MSLRGREIGLAMCCVFAFGSIFTTHWGKAELEMKPLAKKLVRTAVVVLNVFKVLFIIHVFSLNTVSSDISTAC